jgi:hypothetical protein
LPFISSLLANKKQAPVLEDAEDDVENQMFDTSDGEDVEMDEEDDRDEVVPIPDDAETKEDPTEPLLKWELNALPIQPAREFMGMSGPRHALCPEKSSPIDYFLLYIPMYMFSKIAEYTNKKAGMAKQNNNEGRRWYPTSGAEMKAWFASIIWWCTVKNLSMISYLETDIDLQRPRRWFNSTVRWTQIRRFIKLSDPTKDPDNKADRLYRVREVFDTLIKMF